MYDGMPAKLETTSTQNPNEENSALEFWRKMWQSTNKINGIKQSPFPLWYIKYILVHIVCANTHTHTAHSFIRIVYCLPSCFSSHRRSSFFFPSLSLSLSRVLLLMVCVCWILPWGFSTFFRPAFSPSLSRCVSHFFFLHDNDIFLFVGCWRDYDQLFFNVFHSAYRLMFLSNLGVENNLYAFTVMMWCAVPYWHLISKVSHYFDTLTKFSIFNIHHIQGEKWRWKIQF